MPSFVLKCSAVSQICRLQIQKFLMFLLDQQSAVVSDEVSCLLKTSQFNETKASLVAWMKQASSIKLGQVKKTGGLLETLCYPVFFFILTTTFIFLADPMFLGKSFTWQILHLIEMSFLISSHQLKSCHVEMKARGRKKSCLTEALY